jgi:hypothetical protein
MEIQTKKVSVNNKKITYRIQKKNYQVFPR